MAEKRVPLGKALEWTEEEVDALSEVSPQDIAEAQTAGRRDGAPDFAAKLDAKAGEGA